MSDTHHWFCSSCGQSSEGGNRFCSHCGAQRVPTPSTTPGPALGDSTSPVSTADARRSGGSGLLIAGAIAAVFVLVVIGVIIGISMSHSSSPAAAPASTTVVPTTATVTTLIPSTTTSVAPTTVPTTQPCCGSGDWIIPYTDIARGPIRPFVSGDWIAVVASLDVNASTEQKRQGIRNAADRLAGTSTQMYILLSSDFANLRPGYLVVFQGPYRSESEATEFCTRAGQQIPSQCYARLVVK